MSSWFNNQKSLNNRTFTGDLDWTQWLGTTPKRDPDPMRFFNWYWFWDYSGGLLIGQAAHVVDAIMWFMNSKAPSAVTCTGGKIHLPGVQVPETATIAIEFPEDYLATLLWATRQWCITPATTNTKTFTATRRGWTWDANNTRCTAIEQHRNEAKR